MNASHRSDVVLKVGIVSYDYPHLKTEQLLHRLLFRNKLAAGPRFDIKLLALPFSPRPLREVLFAHRPDQERSIPTRELASRYGRLPGEPAEDADADTNRKRDGCEI